MGLMDRLLGRKPASGSAAVSVPTIPVAEQAVLVYLCGSGLPEAVYEQCDVATLEDQLIDVIERDGLGEFDGNEFGPEGVTLYMYSPNAERLFAGVEHVLRTYPLCRGARVVIRAGQPGAPERQVVLGVGD